MTNIRRLVAAASISMFSSQVLTERKIYRLLDELRCILEVGKHTTEYLLELAGKVAKSDPHGDVLVQLERMKRVACEGWSSTEIIEHWEKLVREIEEKLGVEL
ncbi:MAG: hypothetical protein SWK76_17100 [Actinomycetota bacterium]|nr:hypothetical protein [Actinomycetota bacterium]